MEDELKGGSNEIKAEGGMDSETLPAPGEWSTELEHGVRGD